MSRSRLGVSRGRCGWGGGVVSTVWLPLWPRGCLWPWPYLCISRDSWRRTAKCRRQRAADGELALASERTFLYQNRVIFAERELNDNTPHRAEQLLDECPRTSGAGNGTI